MSSSRFFPWVLQDTIELIAQDKLKPEWLVLLHNLESRVTKEPPRQAGIGLVDGQFTITEETSESCTSAFVKAIPNINALSQVWLVYTAIRTCHTQDTVLNEALLAHLESLIEYNALYTWKAIAEYHLAICRQCFGTGVVNEWATSDVNLMGRILLP